jgi:hypothetical protein
MHVMSLVVGIKLNLQQFLNKNTFFFTKFQLDNLEIFHRVTYGLYCTLFILHCILCQLTHVN